MKDFGVTVQKTAKAESDTVLFPTEDGNLVEFSDSCVQAMRRIVFGSSGLSLRSALGILEEAARSNSEQFAASDDENFFNALRRIAIDPGHEVTDRISACAVLTVIDSLYCQNVLIGMLNSPGNGQASSIILARLCNQEPRLLDGEQLAETVYLSTPATTKRFLEGQTNALDQQDINRLNAYSLLLLGEVNQEIQLDMLTELSNLAGYGHQELKEVLDLLASCGNNAIGSLWAIDTFGDNLHNMSNDADDALISAVDDAVEAIMNGFASAVAAGQYSNPSPANLDFLTSLGEQTGHDEFCQALATLRRHRA